MQRHSHATSAAEVIGMGHLVLRLARYWRVGVLALCGKTAGIASHALEMRVRVCLYMSMYSMWQVGVTAKILLTLQLIRPTNCTTHSHHKAQHSQAVCDTDLMHRRQRRQRQQDSWEGARKVGRKVGRKNGRKEGSFCWFVSTCKVMSVDLSQQHSQQKQTHTHSHHFSAAFELWSPFLCQAMEFGALYERWLGMMTCWHLVTLCHLSPAAQYLSSFP